MKTHRFVEKKDWLEKRLSKRTEKKTLNLILNSKAFSLVELMVTVAIGGFVALGISTVFVFAVQQFQVLIEKNQSEENSLMVAYYTRKFLSQAVNLRAARKLDNAFIAGHQTDLNQANGFIDVSFSLKSYNSTDNGMGDFHRFAIFNRETAAPDSSNSFLKRTAIFLQDDSKNRPGIVRSSENLSYKVFFNIANSGSNLIPTRSDIWLDKIHEFEVQKTDNLDCDGNGVVDLGAYAVELVRESDGFVVNCATNSYPNFSTDNYQVKTMSLKTTIRYFNSSRRDLWDYYKTTGINIPYRDVDQTIKINFRNNVLTQSSVTGGSGQDERVFGNAYFYDFIAPIFGR